MLYIMRHGRTDWNARRLIQGRTDIPLSDEGRRMAEEAAARYADVRLDMCCCSPLRRARETAEILLRGRDVPVTVDERLTEMCFGVCEGSVNRSGMPDDGSPMSVFFSHPERYEPPEGGESMAELFSRTGEFLSEVVYPALDEGKDILIVGHGAMNSSIVCRVKGLPLESFWSVGICNCELARLI